MQLNTAAQEIGIIPRNHESFIMYAAIDPVAICAEVCASMSVDRDGEQVQVYEHVFQERINSRLHPNVQEIIATLRPGASDSKTEKANAFIEMGRYLQCEAEARGDYIFKREVLGLPGDELARGWCVVHNTFCPYHYSCEGGEAEEKCSTEEESVAAAPASTQIDEDSDDEVGGAAWGPMIPPGYKETPVEQQGETLLEGLACATREQARLTTQQRKLSLAGRPDVEVEGRHKLLIAGHNCEDFAPYGGKMGMAGKHQEDYLCLVVELRVVLYDGALLENSYLTPRQIYDDHLGDLYHIITGQVNVVLKGWPVRRPRRLTFILLKEKWDFCGSFDEWKQLCDRKPVLNCDHMLLAPDAERQAMERHELWLRKRMPPASGDVPLRHILTDSEADRYDVTVSLSSTYSSIEGALATDLDQSIGFTTPAAFIPSPVKHGRIASISKGKLFVPKEYLAFMGDRCGKCTMYFLFPQHEMFGSPFLRPCERHKQ